MTTTATTAHQMTPAMKQAANKAPKFWNIIEEEDLDTATLTFYGEIVETKPFDFWTGEQKEGLFICQDEFLADLARLKDKKTINIKINSGGGDLFVGISIHNALKALPAVKNVIIEGLAASAASIIACAGDTVTVYPGSVFMVHKVWLNYWDSINLDTITKLKVMLEACEKAAAEIYAEKSGLSVDECLELINAETWLTGKEAIDKGFADTLADGSVQISASNKFLFVNGEKKLNLTKLKHAALLNFTKVEDLPEEFLVNSQNDGKEFEVMEEKFENLEQLRAAYPEFCSQLENNAKQQAIADERRRLKEIEEIENTIGDKALINSAKFGENPLDAKDLAFIAMKNQAKIGATMTSAIKSDVEKSGAADVGAEAPAASEEKQQEVEKQAALVNIVNIAKNIR